MRKITVGLGVGLSIWVLLPFAMLIMLTSLSLSATISGPQAPSWVPVRSSESATNETVDIALQWQPQVAVFAPAWHGLVQSVEVKTGDVLKDGTPIVVIDGVTRRAALTPAPLYRSVSFGMRGPDVGWLNDFLARIGLPRGTGQSATSGTMRGAKQFAATIGARYHGTFDSSWLVFVPVAGYTVQTVSLTTGTPAPALGSKILESAPNLARATVVNLGSMDAAVAQGKLTTKGSTVALSDATIGANVKQIPEGTQLTVSGTTVPTDDSSVALPPSLPALQLTVAPLTPVLQANLVRPTHSGDFLVPSAAIFSGKSGKTCLVEKVADHSHVVKVKIVADSGQGVVATGRLQPTASVRVPGGGKEKCD